MQLIELTEKDRSEYNSFVMNQPTGSFLQSWEWGEWQKELGREVCRIKIVDNSGLLIGCGLLIKMPLFFGKYYLYAPYGPVLAEGENFKFQISNFKLILNGLKIKFPDAIFIRIEPKASVLSAIRYPLITKTTNIQPGKTLLIDLTKSQDELLAAMHHKTRYNIKLAQKHGVEIQNEFGLTIGKGLFAEEAVELIYQTAKRQGFMAQDRSYFEKLIDFFAVQNNQGDLKLHIYKALYNQQLLASAIIIDFGNTRTYLFGGSSEENKNLMAPYLLHFTAMLDAKALGKNFYDFWGIETSSGDTPGFVRFKLGFGGQSLQYGGAYDVILSSWNYKIYGLTRNLNKIIKKLR